MRNFFRGVTSLYRVDGQSVPEKAYLPRSDGGNMSFVWRRAARSLLAVAASAALGLCAAAQEKKGAAKSGGKADAAAFQVPVEYYKLPNGLRVVLSQDHTAPTVCVAAYYRIGFRIEPKDRTG